MAKPLPPFDTLAPEARQLLMVLSALQPGQAKTALLGQLRQLGVAPGGARLIDKPLLDGLLDTLQGSGWLQGQQDGTTQLYCVNPTQRNRVLSSFRQQPQAVQLLQRLWESLPAPDPWQQGAARRLSQRLWLALLLGDAALVELALEQFARSVPPATAQLLHPLPQLLADADGQALYAELPLATRMLLLEDHLALANHQFVPAEQSYRQGLALLDHSPSPGLRLQLALQALWRGDEQTLANIPDTQLELMHRLLTLFQQGQRLAMLVLLREWMAEQRKLTRKRRIDLPMTLNLFYCLALIEENDAAQLASLKQAVNFGQKEGYGIAYAALQRFVERLQGKPGPPLYSLPQQEASFDGLVQALALHWLDDPLPRQQPWRDKLQASQQQLQAAGYHWLAGQYQALREAQSGAASSSVTKPSAPLVELLRPLAQWQLALDALAQLKPGATLPNKASDKKTRVAWFIDLDAYQDVSLEPREQKLGAKGQWSKGRPIALKRLLEDGDSLDFLNDQDRQTSRLIQFEQSYYGRNYYLPIHTALPRLVGHPALYWRDAPDARIDLVLGEVSLRLRSADGQIQLSLEPAAAAAGGQVVEKETPTRLKVYPSNRDVRQIAEIIGKGLTVPQSAKAQLVDAIGAIAPLLPIQSDLPELAAHVDEVSADTRLYAHLLPLAEGLRLQLLVRPLANGGWFRPGQGSERLLGEQDGRTVQALRVLAAERAALQRVLDACPGLANADSDGQEWQLHEPQDALQVLSELQAIDGDQLECVWPEGERLRIKGRSEIQQLKLGLKQQGDWFQLQGGLTLEDGKVLQLRQLLELLKAHPGRFIKLADKDWLAIGNSLRKRLDELAHLAERINDDGLRLSPLTTPLLAELAEEAGEFKAGREWQAHLQRLQSLRDYQPAVPSTLQAELRDYQVEGFNWLARLAHWGVGACLADDMGLGKTVQTLALLLLRAQHGPQLVVAPTSVALNWLNEARRFAPTLQLHNYSQQRHLADLGPRDLVIVSYSLLQQEAKAFAAIPWNSVVLDEAQAIKNAQTKRSQAAMALQADFRLVATGTPLENHLGELWNLMRFINPGLLGSQESFAQRFATPIEQGDAGARRALKQLIQPFVLRRLKSQVLDELPARTEISYSVPLSNDEALQYEALRQQAVEKLSGSDAEERKPLQVLAEITRLRRFCCHPSLVIPGSPLASSKLAAFQAIVGELLANRHKALVFSQFVDHLAIVRQWLDEQGIRYQYLDGSTPAKARQAAVDAFQSGDGEIFLISLKAGGSGLNLTAADYVIHLDPWWNPAVEDQASDRAHRMGQQRPVTIYRLVTGNTIEQQIVALHGRKRDLADSLLDGGEVSGRLDADALLALLRGEG